MGNSGSIQDLHADRLSDMHSFYRTSRNCNRNPRKVQSQSEHTSLILLHGSGEGHSKEWTKSFPRPKLPSMVSPPPNLKVLPHLNENTRLRSTANGAILHAGGTISGRREQLQSSSLVEPMKRSRTLIYNRGSEGTTNKDARPVVTPPVFRRAQTHQQLSYRGRPSGEMATGVLVASSKTHTHTHIHTMDAKGLGARASTVASKITDRGRSRSEPSMAQEDPAPVVSKPKLKAAGGSRDEKHYRYKKRRAPAAPPSGTKVTNAAASLEDGNNNSKNSSSVTSIQSQIPASTAALSKDAKESLVKARLFRTKAQTESTQGKQRKKSAAEASLQCQHQVNAQQQQKMLPQNQLQEHLLEMRRMEPLKLPYRREQSFDATLLRQREKDMEPIHSPLTTVTLQRQNKRKDITHLTSSKAPVTKIPQLKRTFYFGMEASRFGSKSLTETSGGAKSDAQPLMDRLGQIKPNAKPSKRPVLKRLLCTLADNAVSMNRVPSGCAPRGEEAQDGAEDCSTLLTPTYDIGLGHTNYAPTTSDDKEARANGLQVHVRPTLPRRQLDIPRFNPATAWRRLAEEQQNLELLRTPIILVESSSSSQPAANVNVKPTAYLEHKEANSPAGRKVDEGGESKLLTKEPPIHPIRHKPETQVPTDDQLLREPEAKKSTQVNPAPWTPQQDLEDDSSSDELHTSSGDHKHGLHMRTTTGGYNTVHKAGVGGGTSVHVFSLSLPRDGQLPMGNDIKIVSDKLLKQSSSNLQKLKCTVSVGNCGWMPKHGDDSLEQHQVSSPEAELSSGKCDKLVDGWLAATGTGITGNKEVSESAERELGCSSNYRSDNWVLGKSMLCLMDSRRSVYATSGSGTLEDYPTSIDKIRWQSLASGTMQPLSLSSLTGGKHIVYLPNDTTSSAIAPKDKELAKTNTLKKEPRERESLQDTQPSITSWGNGRMGREKPQRFNFQSTVRLIEKRRLSEKLSKETEIKEAQRCSELEAMKRVEEDFQRKRAYEKATIRQQLRLISSNLENTEQHQSLPGKGVEELHNAGKSGHNCQQHTSRGGVGVGEDNTHIYYRADPDGAVSSPSNSPVLQDVNAEASVFQPHDQFLFNREDDIGADIAAFQSTASLVKPYLQSIVW